MSGSKIATSCLIATIVVAWVGYDVWAYVKGYDYTITATIRNTSQGQPILPFATGLIGGYWLGLATARRKKNVTQSNSGDSDHAGNSNIPGVQHGDSPRQVP